MSNEGRLDIRGNDGPCCPDRGRTAGRTGRQGGGNAGREADGGRRRYFSWKSLADRLAAALLLVPGLPLMAILIVLVRCTSRGPGIYRQVRVGKDGRLFTMYKLRSMRQDAESQTGAIWTTSSDPRITPLGHILRKTHLDELPQLLNVLKGEMSLIGPRPERPEFVRVLEEQIDGYRDRLAVLPGVTGLAQINLPPDTDLDSVRRKQLLDRMYIETADAWLDFRILLCTCLRMFGCRGTRMTRWLGVHRTVDVNPLPPGQEQLGQEQAGREQAGREATPENLKRAALESRGRQSVRDTMTWGDTLEFPAVTRDRTAAVQTAEAEVPSEGYDAPDSVAEPSRIRPNKPR